MSYVETSLYCYANFSQTSPAKIIPGYAKEHSMKVTFALPNRDFLVKVYEYK